MTDILLHGGTVVDGSGGAPVVADVAITGERIEEVRPGIDRDAAQVVDISGLLVMPGFIDTHVHGDVAVTDPHVQAAMLSQGITTVIVGQDGLGCAPGSAGTLNYVSRYFAAVNGPFAVNLDDTPVRSVADYLGQVDGNTAVNVAMLVPQGNVRYEVLGPGSRAPGVGELAAMQALVEQGLDDGALGLSSGLDYVPSIFATAMELAQLCEPVARRGRVYVTHMRGGYETNAPIGMNEVFDIAEHAGVRAHVSHYHGPAELLCGLLDDGARRGVDVSFDSYPYLRGFTTLAMLALPADIQRHGVDGTVSALREPATRRKLVSEWFPATGDLLARITIGAVSDPDYLWCEGRTIVTAAEQVGADPGELVCDLLIACDLAVGCVLNQSITSTEDDMRAMLRHPAHLAGSDGIYLGGRPHPRGWGAFARLLARHTRELHDYDWGGAAVHLSAHAARRFGLADRGRLQAGFSADLSVIDPGAVADTATYEVPRSLATGVRHVITNGKFALRDNVLTGANTGKALRA